MSSVQTDRESVAQHLCDALNENHRLRHALNELLKALQDLLRKTSTIECLGEWEALDINTVLRKTNRAVVDAVIKAACDAIDKATKETK